MNQQWSGKEATKAIIEMLLIARFRLRYHALRSHITDLHYQVTILL
jgi:hypothetical protein